MQFPIKRFGETCKVEYIFRSGRRDGETEVGRTLSCLFGEFRREDDDIFDEQVAVRGWALEKWHALALDSLYEPGLCYALAHQGDDVSV